MYLCIMAPNIKQDIQQNDIEQNDSMQQILINSRKTFNKNDNQQNDIQSE
jgi:hypothetical protein